MGEATREVFLGSSRFIHLLLVHTGLSDSGCECTHFNLGELGIKYLLQEGMPRKQSPLAESWGWGGAGVGGPAPPPPARLSRYLISMENSRCLCPCDPLLLALSGVFLAGKDR